MDKIEQYLQSRDIELIQLGCNLLTTILPKQQWRDYLINIMGLPYYNYEFIIEGNSITVNLKYYDFGNTDLWAMKRKTPTPHISFNDLNNDTRENTGDAS